MSIFFKKEKHGRKPSRTTGRNGNQGGVARATGVVSAATLLSRIIGAVRDVAIASFFGAGMVSDAFVAAFRIPNLLRRMFGEGSLSIAFVPVYSDYYYHRERQAADQLVASAFRALALALSALALMGMAAAPWLVHLLAPGFADEAETFALTVNLTRIMFPYIVCIGLVAMSMGVLNVMGHFAAPALAPVALNIAMICAMALGSCFVASKSGLAYWLAGGVLAGGICQIALQLPFLIKNGIRFQHHAQWWHPAFKPILTMLGPSLIGAAVYQINGLVITLLATLQAQGSVSHLYYADRLVQFPLGLFGIAAATAVLPTMTRQAAQQQHEALQATFSHALRLVFFITLPAMAGLIVLREPIVSLLFQRGAFGGRDMQLTADALLYYAIGLWAFAAVRVVLNIFYAFKDTRTPVRMAVLAVAANLILGLTLSGPMGYKGLALALSLASTIHLGLLAWAAWGKLGPVEWRTITFSLFKSGICAAIMGLCVHALRPWVLPGDAAGLAVLPGLGVCILAGAIIFGLLAHAVRSDELRHALAIALKRTS
ncbi:MAG: murein biosynthesis integral membrane protein MurJ [Desulfatitalea sp.]|nr:murein biosynthesis integral membrane protein MurJ [Desulfatitalea sp.]NNK02829.1 murein biosynthesis integral membrane protein MurJ [Desulfatitalea sp.]